MICGMDAEVYQSDRDAAPDRDFAAGELRHVVVGNRGRLLDARRTPLLITAVSPERGEFEVRIEAFEDRGARWELPIWEIKRLQFARDSADATPETLVRLQQAVDRLNRELSLEADPAALAGTQTRIAQRRVEARKVVRGVVGSIDLADCIERRTGDPRLFDALQRFLASEDLVDLDRRFCQTLVSNPNSGELVKGHAIILAELGLCAYHGTVIRDPALFTADQSPAQRAQHLVSRIAFARELWSHLGRASAESVSCGRGRWAAPGPRHHVTDLVHVLTERCRRALRRRAQHPRRCHVAPTPRTKPAADDLPRDRSNERALRRSRSRSDRRPKQPRVLTTTPAHHEPRLSPMRKSENYPRRATMRARR